MSELAEGRPRVGVSTCRTAPRSRSASAPRETLRLTDGGRLVNRGGDADHTAALAARATRGRHVNTLQHAFGQVTRQLGSARRADLVARIAGYRSSADPLSVPVAVLAHYASDGALRWLAGQSYLAPYPPAPRLRHALPR